MTARGKRLTPEAAQTALLECSDVLSFLKRGRDQLMCEMEAAGFLRNDGLVLPTSTPLRTLGANDTVHLLGGITDPLNGVLLCAATCVTAQLEDGVLGPVRLWHRIGRPDGASLRPFDDADATTVDTSLVLWSGLAARETTPAWLRRMTRNLSTCEHDDDASRVDIGEGAWRAVTNFVNATAM